MKQQGKPMQVQGRQFIFFYHDSPNPEEVYDRREKIPIPQRGDIIKRKGKKWEVKRVDVLKQPAKPRTPTYIIQLMNPI